MPRGRQFGRTNIIVLYRTDMLCQVLYRLQVTYFYLLMPWIKKFSKKCTVLKTDRYILVFDD